MPLPEWLLRTLACPGCKGPLFHPPPLPPGEGRGEGVRNPVSNREQSPPDELHCLNCGLAYPIRDGIAELLPDEAQPLPRSGS